MAKQKNENTKQPPIVVVLGHVDHGKTTLLDCIRKSNVASREAGGITQSIGASEITTPEGKELTFIDTPGHAVFDQMRSRGADLADIAVLVIAGDDGIKPQTKEAIGYIKEQEVPYVVAFTKSDLPTSNIDSIKAELAKEEVLLEGFGGDIPFVNVSGKTGDGIPELLEMIDLLAEVNGVSEKVEGKFRAFVLESVKDKRGSLVSIVITNGSVCVGDEIATTKTAAKVKGIFDHNGKSIKSQSAGRSAQILGFTDLPEAGTEVGMKGEISEKSSSIKSGEDIEIDEDSLPVIFKAKTAGSLEALIAHVPEEVVVVSSGVGDVTESDIFLAKSSGAKIYLFESKAPGSVKKLAATESVEIESFDIIYKLFERLDEVIKEGQTKLVGHAEIKAIFPYNKMKVAGSKMLSGEVTSKSKVVIMRGDKEIGHTKVSSLKKEKKEVEIVKQGEEFGVMFSPFVDFEVGDVILSIR